jgi:hypothetical protein
MPKTKPITDVSGSGMEVVRLADEVGKRGWPGQHNPTGARTSGSRRRQGGNISQTLGWVYRWELHFCLYHKSNLI